MSCYAKMRANKRNCCRACLSRQSTMEQSMLITKSSTLYFPLSHNHCEKSGNRQFKLNVYLYVEFAICLNCLLLPFNLTAMITEKQFEALFRTHFTDMCDIACSIVKDKDQARDIAQQMFVHLWDKRNDFDELPENTRAYLCRSVINMSLNHLEKYRRLSYEDEFTASQLSRSSVDGNIDYFEGEVETAVQRAIAHLPNKCQTVFVLSRFNDMSYQQIADSLDISVKAVEKHMMRALKELRVSLKPYLNKI